MKFAKQLNICFTKYAVDPISLATVRVISFAVLFLAALFTLQHEYTFHICFIYSHLLLYDSLLQLFMPHTWQLAPCYHASHDSLLHIIMPHMTACSRLSCLKWQLASHGQLAPNYPVLHGSLLHIMILSCLTCKLSPIIITHMSAFYNLHVSMS